MIVTLCQQIFFPTPNKFILMRSTTTFSGLLMELKHEKFGQYPVFAKFAITQIITVANRSPHTTHTTSHTPHPNPRLHPSPAIHSFISSQNILFACPTISATTCSGLLQPASAIIPFICALILIFSSTSSMLPHSLSQGQRQRLAVASILSMEPDIIMLDEPTTGQDRGQLNKFLARMKMLNEAGKTIIQIRYDMGVVAEYASRTIVRKGGRDIPVLLAVEELERYFPLNSFLNPTKIQ